MLVARTSLGLYGRLGRHFADTFDTNVDDWTAGANTTLAHSTDNGGELSITNGAGGTAGFAYHAHDLTRGVAYVVLIENTGTGTVNLRVGTTANGTQYANVGGINPGASAAIFTPTSARVFITLRITDATEGSNRRFDNVSVRPL